jgi:hypothetical protein
MVDHRAPASTGAGIEEASVATLINAIHPQLRIVVSAEPLRIRSFMGGKLVVERDDPDYEQLMSFATSSPEVRVVETAVWCPECGEPFAGGAAKPEMGKHRKELHFDAWIADKEAATAQEKAAVISERSGIPCPICEAQGGSTERFPDFETVAVHAKAIHDSDELLPRLDAEGNTIGGDGEGGVPAVSSTIPPAKSSR